ncbi:hypothetical protein Fmac_027457 [Flemingia macrophylla]|uniref:Uncharacterized protein n=1 Tax=Flemingia macrophylla TaxID=520843 RepID=A0ABD1LI00_9FABA
MEDAGENACIAEQKKKTEQATRVVVAKEPDSATVNNGGAAIGFRISPFDFSVENFFRDMDAIARLSGEEEPAAAFDQTEIQRISSSVTFLREWRDFRYQSRSIKFAYGLESSDCSEGKYVGTIDLPPFSSVSVPEHDMQKEQLEEALSHECRDFVMNVGGSVWALDWCPQIHEKPDCSIKCEFIAVAAHPPGSSYHKMGAPLTGRGVIQIWCLLNIRGHNDKSTPKKRPKGRPRKNPSVVEDMNCDKNDGGTNDKSAQIKMPKGRPRKNLTVIAVDDMDFNKKDGGTNDISTQIKKPRGRPRKNPIVTTVDDLNCEIQHIPVLAIQFPENSTEFPTPDGNCEKNEDKLPKGTNEILTQRKPRGRPRKNSTVISVDDMNCETQNSSACDVQIAQNSTVFPASDGNLGKNEEILLITYKRKREAKKDKETIEESALIKRPRKKHKSNSRGVTEDDPNCENESMPLDLQVLEDSTELLSPDEAHDNCNEYALKQNSVTKQGHAKEAVSACNTVSNTLVKSSGPKNNHTEGRHGHGISQPLQYENEANHPPDCTSELEAQPATCSIPEDINLPRVVSCLAHNGKVAWDVKWRPTNISDSVGKYRMGHLAVLLGNGSLEVWEVPLPHVLRAIYMHREGTDPRFIKLEPVFKCSMLKRGGLQSIPLTVEWSVMPPHDYLLAGCHDGTVALWKFCTTSSSKCEDSKPVLCFGGDTVPIRTVAWAPFEGDPESSNVVVTAGHEGLKFWDLRNPFRPLRSLHPAPRMIYSLDWLSKPSCIIMSFEDGTMRTISLVKAANDFPVTGEIYSGKRQFGLHGSSYSSFAIWSVQVSRITGMVAYCGTDGAVFRFQLTTKAVETDHVRNRPPRFLCGSITEEDSTIVINTPVSNTPFLQRKPQDKARYAESFRDLLSKTNASRSANNQMAETPNSDCQTLAICAGEDVGSEFVSEEDLCSMKQPKTSKVNTDNLKKPVRNLGLVYRDDGDVPKMTPGTDDEKSDFVNKPEVFPPKMAALHRVRWNMNKGSEKWLCFGGASGLVRCQEIVYSDIDKKLALKR